jgi:integrase
MALVAGCLGLRVSEIVGLQWSDIDFAGATIMVQRSVVHGKVDSVKTEYSQDHVPMDRELAAALLRHREGNCYPTPEGWVFASPRTGRPFHQDPIQQDYLRPAGQLAGGEGSLGWHTFRHSYRSWLDEIGAAMSVQKELMRHASIQTTMNIYGRAMTDTKRQANSKVVRMVLGSASDGEAKKPAGKRENRLPAAIGS